MSEFGVCRGDVCWRDGCQGVIQKGGEGGCSCHISPPCGYCVDPNEFCPVCGWEAQEETDTFNDFTVKYADQLHGVLERWKPRPLDPRKFDWRSRPHSNASMIKEGVYPESMTQAEVLEAVKGTFGGRFEYFRDGKFKYIAYTD